MNPPTVFRSHPPDRKASDSAHKKWKAPSRTREPSIYRVAGRSRRLAAIGKAASFGLHRYAIFSSWLSSLLSSWLSSLLFSLPLFVTSFWLTQSFCLSLTSRHSFTLKTLTSNLQKKMKKTFIYFLSSKTLIILDEKFLQQPFYRTANILYHTLRRLKTR